MTKPLLPHGPGFSFVDNVEFNKDKKSLRATKWLDPQLGFFQDHFPGRPLMPAVLLVECAAQAAGGLWDLLHEITTPQQHALAQIVQFRVNQSVFPGETIITEVSLEKEFGLLAQFLCDLKVNDVSVASGRVVLSSGASANAKAL